MLQSSPDDEDQQLLHRANSGDQSAFHSLIDRHAQRLYRVAVSLVGNAADAEDVLQEALMGAYRGLASFEARSSVKTWLTRIVVVQSAQWRRSRKRKAAQPLDDVLHESVAAPIGNPEIGVDVRSAMQLLSPDHREVLVLREFEQLSYEEIAQVLGLPRGTVESRLHRARSELKEKLKSYLP